MRRLCLTCDVLSRVSEREEEYLGGRGSVNMHVDCDEILRLPAYTAGRC